MKIHLAKSAGFCFGVKRAINIALTAAGSGNKVCMLGDIVHNENVVKQMQKAGIKKIKALGTRVQDKTLLIRAHGTAVDIITKALKSGYRIVDATCPMVKEIHKIAQSMEAQGYRIIVIGDESHDEVKGIIGNLTKPALVIGDINIFSLEKVKKFNRAAVVVQSTQNLDKVLQIVGLLKRHIQDVRFFNTICRTTRTKQEEIKKMPLENDVMIIIGSKSSANTKRLYEISKSRNPKSFWINAKREVKRGWFRAARTVGITAGASTTEATIRDVINYIRHLTKT